MAVRGRRDGETGACRDEQQHALDPPAKVRAPLRLHLLTYLQDVAAFRLGSWRPAGGGCLRSNRTRMRSIRCDTISLTKMGTIKGGRVSIGQHGWKCAHMRLAVLLTSIVPDCVAFAKKCTWWRVDHRAKVSRLPGEGLPRTLATSCFGSIWKSWTF